MNKVAKLLIIAILLLAITNLMHSIRMAGLENRIEVLEIQVNEYMDEINMYFKG